MGDGVLEYVAKLYGQHPELYEKLLRSLLVIVAAWLVRRVVLAAVHRATEEPKLRYGWKKGTTYAAFILATIVVANIWLAGLAQLGTFLGLASAGVAIALKDPLVNMAGWLFILARKPFTVGDRIEIGGRAGDVIDIRVFQFSLMEVGGWVNADQSTGRVLHVPNSLVFTEILSNATMDFPFIWHELPVLVTFESNWRKARDLMGAILAEHCTELATDADRYLKKTAKKWFILFSKLDPIVYTSVADSGVLLTARFLCPPRRRRAVEDTVWSAILDAFAACDDVDLAYPTTRFYDNGAEGKPGTRPSGD